MKQRDLLFLSLGFLLFGCAGAVFPYHNYGLDLPEYKGKLLGPDPKDDRDFSACAPSATDAHPCTVIFTHEFQSLKVDYKDMQNRIVDLERQLQQCHRMGD